MEPAVQERDAQSHENAKGRSSLKQKVQDVRVAHCRVLGDCADMLHEAQENFAADCKALLQIFTAVAQRLATLEIDQMRQEMSGVLSQYSRPSFVIDKNSLALAIREPEPEPTDETSTPSSNEEDDEEEEEEPPLQQFAAPQLRIALQQASVMPFTATAITSAASISVFMRLLQGAGATKVNQKNLKTSRVHLYLSIENGTADQPGWICARKKDSITWVSLSLLQQTSAPKLSFFGESN